MSNTIRYDALLTRHLALELDASLRGERVLDLRFDRERAECRIAFPERVLVWSAQPRFESSTAQSEGDLLTIPKKATVESIAALPDERILRLDLGGGSRANCVRSIVVELLPPEPDVIALDDDGRVLKRLVRAASRPQTRGQPYAAPPTRNRVGVAEPLTRDEWVDLFRDVSPAERAAVLIRRAAYLSPINAEPILAVGGDSEAALADAHTRYLELLSAPSRAFLIPIGKRRQPYVHDLWHPDATPQPNLLTAMANADSAETTTVSPIVRLEDALQRERKKRERLLQESERAGADAVRLRAAADLLSTHAADVKRGSKEVVLPGFDGQPRQLELDPALSARANADAWYAEARKRERAAERVPALIRETDAVIAALEEKLQRARAGEAIDLPARTPQKPRKQAGRRLPYRRYRSSGGLEVRVGRGSKDNDELTFGHSSPNDIWMHARAVGGAHVVLRWTDGDNNPPAADLREAAVLAALHSKARHAGTVPIDWTRRKYVRKGRRAPTGQVTIERAKTLFVQPDEQLEKKLQWPEET